MSDEPDDDRDEREPEREAVFDDEDRRYDDAVDRSVAFLNAKTRLKLATDPAERKRLADLIRDYAPRSPGEWRVLDKLKER